MIRRMNHASFTVADLDRSVAFYRDVLQLELLDVGPRDADFSSAVTGIPGADLRIAYLGTPESGAAVELVEYLAPPGEKIDTRTCNVGSAHICFDVADFDGMVERLRDHGVRFSGVPSVIPGGPNQGRGVLYFEDPDGNTLEFIGTEAMDLSDPRS